MESLEDCFNCHFCKEGTFLVDKWETLVLPSILMLTGSLEQVAKDSARHILAWHILAWKCLVFCPTHVSAQD